VAGRRRQPRDGTLVLPDGNGGLFARLDFVGGKSTYYSFTYGNVAVVALDANDVSYEIPANLGYSGGAQTAWLDQELAKLRARADIDFIVVQFHHCTYSTCTSHASRAARASTGSRCSTSTRWTWSSTATTTSTSAPTR